MMFVPEGQHTGLSPSDTVTLKLHDETQSVHAHRAIEHRWRLIGDRHDRRARIERSLRVRARQHHRMVGSGCFHSVGPRLLAFGFWFRGFGELIRSLYERSSDQLPDRVGSGQAIFGGQKMELTTLVV